MSAEASGAGSTGADEVRRAVRAAGDSTFLEIPARFGFGASGLIQALLGGLAIQLGASRAGEPDQTGALDELSKIPAGFVVLWIAAIGLLALALWLVTEAILVRGRSSAAAWARRLEHLSKAATYALLGLSALAFAEGHRTHASATTGRVSAGILASSGGQFLLAGLGIATGAVGVYFVVKGIRLRFRRDIAVPSGLPGRGITVLGAVGYVAKGIVVGLAGAAFVFAALRRQPGEATGLAGGLTGLERLPFGGLLTVVLGFGLIASGVYNITRAWLARF